MKETKVWIDGEFPQVYFDPKTGNESIEGRPFILEDIKTHDRELVKEVCEKIYKDLKPHYGEEVSAVVIEKVLLNLQKEFDK